MCDFCGNKDCKITKQQILERGPIIENNASGIMRLASDDTPQTYCFEGVPVFYSLSALIPDEQEENPHAFMRYVFDEDTGCDGDWEYPEVYMPLQWQTEQEFLERNNLL